MNRGFGYQIRFQSNNPEKVNNQLDCQYLTSLGLTFARGWLHVTQFGAEFF